MTAAWLLRGKNLFAAALVSALTAAGIVAFNTGVFDVTFRDVAMVFSALAPAALARGRRGDAERA